MAMNEGHVRALIYAGKILMPTLTFCVFPLLMLAFNGRVRKSLLKELRESCSRK
jgi:hypothetical protein